MKELLHESLDDLDAGHVHTGDPFGIEHQPTRRALCSIWLTNVIAFGLWYWDLDRGEG